MCCTTYYIHYVMYHKLYTSIKYIRHAVRSILYIPHILYAIYYIWYIMYRELYTKPKNESNANLGSPIRKAIVIDGRAWPDCYDILW